MRCSTCGATVGPLDVTCATCGADPTARGIPPVPSGAAQIHAAAGAVVFPVSQTEASVPPTPATADTTRVGHRRAFTVLWTAIVVVAVAACAVLAVSRAGLAGQLGAANADLRTTQAKLAGATAKIDTLTARVAQLGDDNDAVRSQLGDATAEVKDVRRSLTACQDFIRIAAEMSKGTATQQETAKLTAAFFSCFEGKPPSSLFPGR